MKIKINSPLNHGACAFYRSVGVIPKLKKLLPGIEWGTVEIRDWHNFIDTDIIFLERPMGMHWETAITLIKEFGVKLWVDYDDDLINIPAYHEQTDLYHRKENIESHKMICEAADVITVATEKLKELYGQFNKNIHVVPNAFNDYNYKLAAEPSKQKRILWRGAASQYEDMLTIKNEINELAASHPDWEWYFIGECSKYLTWGIKNSFFKKTIPLIEYFTLLREINPAIVIKPLQDNEFNRAKSNITWIEGTYAGAVTIAPEFEAWNFPGIKTYPTPMYFASKLDYLMNDNYCRLSKFNESNIYITENLLLSKVNLQRLKIAQELIK